jgi:hypothetical protein
MAAFAAAAALLAAGPAVEAQTQTDFDRCNSEARAGGSGATLSDNNPSASPGASLGGSVMTSPGSSEANRKPNASGRLSSSPGSPGTEAGAISGAGAGTQRDASVTRGTAGPTLPGIADAGRTDPAYQQAYRDCLKRRGF